MTPSIPDVASPAPLAMTESTGDGNARASEEDAQAAIDRLCQLLGAEAGSIRLIRDNPNELVRLAFRGSEPLRSVAGEPIRSAPALPWNKALESNEAVFVPTLAALRSQWPEAAASAPGSAAIAGGAQAFCWVPLVGARGLRAVVFLAFHEPRQFGDDERTVIQTAVEGIKWPLLQSAETDRADGLARALAQLHHLALDLNGAMEPLEVARLSLDVLMSVMGADRGTVRRVTADGLSFEVLYSAGHSPERVAERRIHPVGTGTPMDQAARTGSAVFLESTEALRLTGMTAPALAEQGDQSWAVLPLVVAGQPVGAVGLSFRVRREFSETDRSLMTSVAEQCAMALHRSLLSEAERQARLQIEDEHRRLQQIVDVIPFGVAVIQDGRYVLQNSAAAAMMGVDVLGRAAPAKDALGFTITHLDGRPYSAEELPVARSLSTGAVVTGEQLQVVRPGTTEPRTVLCSSVPLHNLAHEASGAVVVFEDITGLKQGEARRNALLARMTHDVKNPLTAIKLRCALAEERVQKGTVNPAQLVEDFRRLQLVASRAATILNNVMQLARQELGLELQITRSRCDLGALATRIVDELRLTTDDHTLRVEVPAEPVMGSWDEQALSSVLENLVGNSIKYSPGGGETTIRVEPESIGGKPWARLTVRDRGPGIAPEDLPHVFDAFYRAQRTAGVEGSGVGLSAVKEIVTAHGGTVDVESQLGQGSLFTVRLPAELA